MVSFAIIEVDDGLAIATVLTDETPEEAAARNHGTVVDPGPYPTYEDATDALGELEGEYEEQQERR